MASMDDYAEHREYYENNIESGFDMFDRLQGTEFLEPDERAYFFELFNDAFVDGSVSRDMFFEEFGMEPGDFPWEDWREWMGYE